MRVDFGVVIMYIVQDCFLLNTEGDNITQTERKVIS